MSSSKIQPQLPSRWQGIVCRMDYEGGFGMISVPPEKTEYFFHATDVCIENEGRDPVFEDFNTGDTVDFVPLKGKRGWKALGVKRL